MSILADVFMLPSCPVCHGIQCFKLCDINKKRKVWQDIYLQLSCTVCCLYSIATHLSPWNRLIYRRKTKNVRAMWMMWMMWMLELFMDVDKLVDIGD